MKLTPEQGAKYIGLQVELARLMMSIGTVKSPQEYVDKCAAIFEMLVMGQIKIASNDEIDEMRDKVRELVGNTDKKPASLGSG